MPIRRDEDCSCINANSIYMYDKTVAPQDLGAISFIILTEPFVTLQCDQELRRISFEYYRSEITKITIHIYPPFPYRSMSCIKSIFQISCKCKIVYRRRPTTNYRQQVIWVTQVSQVNQSFY